MNHIKRILPMLILIPISLYIVTFIFQFANGEHIIKEYLITIGNYNTKIYIFEFWNREGTGYINNLQYVFERFIDGITNIFTEVPTIKDIKISVTNIGGSIAQILSQTINILSCIINIIIFLPFRILWGIILLLYGTLGINFTNSNNITIFNYLWLLSDFQIPYIPL